MANSMQGLRIKQTYEDLIGVAIPDGLGNIKFPNRDAKFLREGYVMSQLDNEGMRQMEKQQEIASKQAFKESLLKDIAINTGAILFDLRNESHQEMRDDKIREFTTPSRYRAKTHDIAGSDEFTPFDTPSPSPFDTPFHDTPPHSDYPSRINRRIDFEEQEEIQALNIQKSKREQTIQEVSQQLDQAQSIKKCVDVDTKVLTRSFSDRAYLNTVDKINAKDDVKNEFKRVGFQTPEKPSGSRDKPKYDEDDNPESSIEPRGKAGRPSKHTKSDELCWKNKKPQTIVNEFNTTTGEHVEINKAGKKRSKLMHPMAM